MKKHLKTITLGNEYPVTQKKQNKYIVRPSPGPHALNSITITRFLKDKKLAKTTSEVKKILSQKEIKIDNRRIKDYKFPIGLMDTISIPQIGDYRITLDDKGKYKIKEEKQPTIKPVKIINKKTMKKGKTQINLQDGRNIISETKEIKPGDTIIIELPTQKIKEHLKLEKGSHILLLEGKHKGDIGTIEKIENEKLFYKNKEGKTIETLKEYAFVNKEQFTR